MNFMRPKGPEYTLKESDWNDMTVSLFAYVADLRPIDCSQYDFAKRLPLQQGFLVYSE